MLKVIGVIILITFLGCDFSNQVNERVDKGVRDAKLEMSSDIDSAKSSFINSYNRVLRSHTDSITLNQFNNLYFSITTTSKYMDSLRAEMNKLDDFLKDTEKINAFIQLDIQPVKHIVRWRLGINISILRNSWVHHREYASESG